MYFSLLFFIKITIMLITVIGLQSPHHSLSVGCRLLCCTVSGHYWRKHSKHAIKGWLFILIFEVFHVFYSYFNIIANIHNLQLHFCLLFFWAERKDKAHVLWRHNWVLCFNTTEIWKTSLIDTGFPVCHFQQYLIVCNDHHYHLRFSVKWSCN